MNANINYDEIPDTSAVQEDLLAALSSQHVTVHTNEEPDFDYMENGDVAFVVKNPHNDENLLIELGGEFSVFFGLWHGQYKAVEYDYDRMKKDIAAILAGNAGALCTHGHHLLQLGHNVPGNLIPEGLNFSLSVADAVHAHIGKLTVVVIAHHLSLLVQVLDDLGVQLVQLGAVVVAAVLPAFFQIFTDSGLAATHPNQHVRRPPASRRQWPVARPGCRHRSRAWPCPPARPRSPHGRAGSCCCWSC